MHAYIHNKISEIGDFKLQSTYEELSENGKLKDEHKHLEVKELTNALHFPREFNFEWIRVVLSRVHEGKIWLDEPIKISKDVIHVVTRYPTSDKEKVIRNPPREETVKIT